MLSRSGRGLFGEQSFNFLRDSCPFLEEALELTVLLSTIQARGGDSGFLLAETAFDVRRQTFISTNKMMKVIMTTVRIIFLF